MSNEQQLRTWDDGKRCSECCNGDRCDDPTHYDRKNCPHCKGTGWALWTKAGRDDYVTYLEKRGASREQALSDLAELGYPSDLSQPMPEAAAQGETPNDFDQELTQALEDRDEAEDMADQLAAQIAAITGEEIGEHSSANNPWRNAMLVADEWIAKDIRRLCRDPESAAPAQPQAQGWKDGDTAKLVNDLRDVAVQFRDAEQLRERIAHVIRPLTYRLSASPAAPEVAKPRAVTQKEDAVLRNAALRASEIVHPGRMAAQPPHHQPQAQGEPEVVATFPFRGFPDGTEYITLQSHREAIAKRDAALVACVEALEEDRRVKEIGRLPDTHFESFRELRRDCDARIDAAITQANGVMGRKEGGV